MSSYVLYARRMWALFLAASIAAVSAAVQKEESPVVELPGRVAPAASGRGSQEMEFRAESGDRFKLLRTELSEALFADPDLHPKTFLLKGRISGDPREFEVTGNLRSIREGAVYDVFYYCDICAVKSSAPGICVCCREPMYLVEEPAEGAGAAVAVGGAAPPRGSISGRVTFQGDVPRSSTPDENARFRPLLDVHSKGAGLRHVLVYLDVEGPAPGGAPVPAPAEKPLVVDQLHHAFTPRLIAVRSGEEVLFGNSDPANHNVRASSPVPGNQFNVMTGIDGRYKHRFVAESNAVPVRLDCDIHPWMDGWIYVFPHSYFAVTDDEGRFEIGQLPPGEHTLVIRQPDIEYQARRIIMIKPGQASEFNLELTPADVKLR